MPANPTPHPLRITFLMPFVGMEGGTRVCAIYAGRLAARGHAVTVVSLARRPQPPRLVRLKRALGDVVKRRVRPKQDGPPRTHFDDVAVPHRRVDTGGPILARDVPDADVLVATWWETAYWAADLPPAKGAKVHLIQHDERIMTDDPIRRERTGDAWRLPGFSRAVVADWLGEIGRREYGAESTLVSNAVDTSFFDAPPRDRGEPFTVSLMYSQAAFKGVDVSLRAIELARRNVPGLRVRAFGEAGVVPSLPLPAGTVYEQHPTQTAIRDVYAASDAYLFGSRCEGFGLPILEAMACRTPVVGARTGAAPELLCDGGGRLVNVGDAEAMAAAIAELATRPAAEWRAASDAAYATARRHDWETATDRFEAVLRAAAEPGAAAGEPGAAAGVQ